MRLVITDTAAIWNINNPLLAQFREITTVVCLEGKAVSDEYECFVSPYQMVGLGSDPFGTDSRKLEALASVAGKLSNCFDYHDDVVFLTDNEPSTLYPYYVTKDLIEHNSIHLIAIPPLNYESKERTSTYQTLLSDLTPLDSIAIFDTYKKLDESDKRISFPAFLEEVQKDMGKMLPTMLNGIYHLEEIPSYFDFSSLRYIPLHEGFDQVEISNKGVLVSKVDFPMQRMFATLGIGLGPNFNPQMDDYVKESLSMPAARLDGKKVCNTLKKQRIALAEANHIPFETVDCPSNGPCAGTCRKCDEEAEYLRKELGKIPAEKRVYPMFDPKKEVPS